MQGAFLMLFFSFLAVKYKIAGEVEYDYKDISVYYYENKVTERLKRVNE